MSRITGIPVRHDGASYSVTVGWDPPLRTFYGQIYDADADEWDPPLKSVGMYKRLNEVRDLIEALGHPYGEAVEQDTELLATLEDHREADDSRTVMTWGSGPNRLGG